MATRSGQFGKNHLGGRNEYLLPFDHYFLNEILIMTKSILSRSALLLAVLSFAVLAEDISVNCDTAKEDIAKLEAEKKSSLE